MFDHIQSVIPFLHPLTGETSGPDYQAGWWFVGFLLGITVRVCGALVRAIRLAGGSSAEL